MKFLLVPLLIIGMFCSFIAAMVAMLFFTGTVETMDELGDLVSGNRDSTETLDEFELKEDKLGQLMEMAENYKTHYEEKELKAESLLDSLTKVQTTLVEKEESNRTESKRLKELSDQQVKDQRVKSLDELAKFYAKIKPQPAADILTQEQSGLSDTMVAQLLSRLPAQQMGKILSSMPAEVAAKITKLMQEQAR